MFEREGFNSQFFSSVTYICGCSCDVDVCVVCALRSACTVRINCVFVWRRGRYRPEPFTPGSSRSYSCDVGDKNSSPKHLLSV